jgi:hypothetical protein
MAQLLGVVDQIEWVVASVADLPFVDRTIDVTFCVEVLEHVGAGHARAVSKLACITRQLAVVTTPNRWFPMLTHDTKLPFCHWLPLIWRDRYARMFGRQDMQNNNLFLTPNDLTHGFSEFVRVSRFLQFPSYDAYRNTVMRPIVRSVASLALCRVRQACYVLCAIFGGGRAFYLLPNLASAYRRIERPLRSSQNV